MRLDIGGKMRTFYLLFGLSFIFLTAVGFAQDDWIVQGSAFVDGQRIVLTPDKPEQGGAAWSPKLVSLEESFTLDFLVYLGEDDEGADGISFVFTTVPQYVGETGGTLGVFGIEPSLSVNIYTYSEGDDSSERITVRVNAPGEHYELPLYRLPTLTDGQEHSMRVRWDASARLLRVYIGESSEDLRIPRTWYYLPEAVFPDETKVHYGFTGATGGAYNLHYFVPKTRR